MDPKSDRNKKAPHNRAEKGIPKMDPGRYVQKWGYTKRQSRIVKGAVSQDKVIHLCVAELQTLACRWVLSRTPKQNTRGAGLPRIRRAVKGRRRVAIRRRRELASCIRLVRRLRPAK